MLSLKRRLPSCSAPASNVGAARSLGGRLSAFAISLVLETVAGRAQAQQTSAWQGTTSDYNTAANWNPAAVPDNNVQGAATQAEFGATGLGTVNLSAAVTTNNWVFDANAQAYTITGDQLEFVGNGITNSAATNQSIANAIAGTGGLTQGGTGTLLLSGTNTYTGATMITAGTLQAGSSFSFSRTSPFTVNGTLDLNGYDNYLSSLAGSAAGNVIVSGNETGLIVGSDNTSTTFAGTISGATGQLEKVGTGTLTLSGNNTYGSSTVIDAGTLMITGTTASFIVGAGDGATLATGAANALTAAPTVNLLNNATFSLNGFSQTIDSLNSTGTGAQVLLGGTVGGGTALTLAGTVGAFSGTISGAGAIIVSQFGNATFSGANTYQGGTTLGNNAAFTVASSTAFGTGAVQVGTNATIAFDTAAGYSLANNILISNQAIFNVAAGPVQSVTGIISDAAGAANPSLLKQGAGTLLLSGANTYSGGTTIAGGTIQVGVDTVGTPGAIVSSAIGTGTLTLDAGTLQAGGAYTIANAVALNAGGGTIDSNGNVFTLSGTIANGDATTGVLTIIDSAAANGVVVVAGAGAYSGATLVQSGTLRAGAANAFSAASDYTVTGTLDLDNFSNTIGSLSGSGQVMLGSGTLTVGDGVATTFSGSIGGTGGLIKGGEDQLVLSGTNTYTGATTINGGSITAGANNAFSAASVTTINSNGSFDLGGFAETVNTVLLDGGLLSNGALTGAVTSTGGVIASITGPASVTLTGGTTQFNAGNGYTGVTDIQGGAATAGVANAYSAASATSVAAGGTLDLGGFAQQINAVALNGGTLQNGALTGAVTSTGGAIADLAGPATVAVTSGTTVFVDANSYTGATTITGATTTANNANAYSAASATSVAAGGTLDLGGFAQQINAVALNGGTLQNGALTGAVTSTGGAIADLAGPATVAVTSGTTVFVDANSYTGATTITGGATTANNANAYSAASATSVAGGGTLDLGGFAQQINAVALNGGTLQNGALTGAVTSTGGAIAAIAGPATVTVTGGTTVFVDANSYTGATTITGGATTASNANAYSAASATSVAAGGTLDLGGFAQTLLSLSGNGAVTNNGSTNATLSIADTLPNSATFSGTISDGRSNTTALAITEGTQYLTGANTYTGGTAIGAQGALAIGNGGMSGSIVGNVANDGILAFDRSDSVTFAGQISGAGAVYQLGTGTTVLTGDSTFTGGTAIAAGSLQLGNGGTTGSVQGNIQNQGTLIFDRADTYTFANVVSGAGNVVQGGSGTTVLTGANTYTGDTTVAAGTLSVDGSIVSPTIIGSGGTLNGTGSVGDVTVSNGGTLGAGTSAAIGVLSINGNVTFEQGSTYAVRIVSANQNDIVLAAGQANLAGGTVQALASGSGFAADTRYLILNAREGIATPFAGVTTNFAFLKPTLIYDANDVFLDVGNPLFTSLTNSTPAEAAVAQALQSGYAAGATGAGATLLNDIAGLSSAQAPAALAQLSGQATSATQEVSFAAGKLFMEALNDQSQHWLRGDKGGATTNEIVLEAKPLPYASSLAAQVNAAFLALDGAEVVPATRTWRAWGTGYTGGQTLKGLDGGTLDLSHRTSGGGFGADYQVNPSLLVGFGLGGSTSSFDVAQSLTSGRLDGAHAGCLCRRQIC